MLVAVALLCGAAPARGGPFADSVVSFTPGSGAGFGQDQLPGIVLGPPHGGGELQGSLDVLSLGNCGSIVLGFDLPLICDGPGADLTVFENPFHSGAPDGPIFVEYGIVEVSQDGVNFVTLPGLAGQTPVLSNPDNAISPLDPCVSGGDQFDLAAVGLAWAKYVRITDAGWIPDPGNCIPPGDQAGFDLDAVAALHACDPTLASSPTPAFPACNPSAVSSPSPTVQGCTLSGARACNPIAASATPTTTPTFAVVMPPTPSASATIATPPSEATPTAPPTSPPAVTATATPTALLPGDVDGNGVVDAADLRQLIAELFDGDGDDASAVGGGTVHSGPGADVNGDGRITAADLAAIQFHRSL